MALLLRLLLWRQAVSVAREQACLLDVHQVEHLFGQALEAHAHPAVGRHAMAEGLEVAFDVPRVQTALAETLDQLVVAVDPLAARGDLDALDRKSVV